MKLITIVFSVLTAVTAINTISLSSRVAVLKERVDSLTNSVDGAAEFVRQINERQQVADHQMAHWADLQTRLAKLSEGNAKDNLSNVQSMRQLLKLIDLQDQNIRELVKRLEQEPAGRGQKWTPPLNPDGTAAGSWIIEGKR
jgi:FtsZ-binding cell division protein ZapB